MIVERARARQVLALGLPIVGGMVSQNLLDLVDIAMVGRLGAAALGAVGLASFANFVAAALLIGLGAGVQALVARRIGEDRAAEAAIPLNGGLATAFLVSVPITVVLIWVAPSLFPWLASHRAEVIAEGVPYWQARLVGIVATALNFSFRGYWHGIGRTGTYMKIIIAVHVTNAVLSYLLIFGPLGLPALGALGAGIGTTAALFLGTLLYWIVTLRDGRVHGFLARLPRGATLSTLVRLAIPSSLQTLLFATGITALVWISGRVGTESLAITNVLINLTKLAVLPSMGLGLAAMTLVSGALGRRDPDDASRWAWDSVQVAALALVAIALPMLAVPRWVLAAFVDDPSVIATGVLPLRIVGAAIIAEAVCAVMANALTGAGAARQAMIATVGIQWLVGLPLAWLFAVELGYGTVGLWSGQIVYRIIAAVALTAFWQGGRWRTIVLG